LKSTEVSEERVIPSLLIEEQDKQETSMKNVIFELEEGMRIPTKRLLISNGLYGFGYQPLWIFRYRYVKKMSEKCLHRLSIVEFTITVHNGHPHIQYTWLVSEYSSSSHHFIMVVLFTGCSIKNGAE
jgi:hypothetical protein